MVSQTPVRRRLPIEVRRTQVLDAALRLISEHGYAALSVEAIAREAGVSKTVVYDAHGGLDPLLLALLEREERLALRSLAEAAPAVGDGADAAPAITAWARTLAAAVAGNPVTWRLMLIPPAGTPEVVRERVQRGRDLVLDQARALVGAAAAGRRAEVDMELAARAVVAVAEEFAKLLLEEPGVFTPQRLAAFAATILVTMRGPG
jgi:AcrR family transcriptional regulator